MRKHQTATDKRCDSAKEFYGQNASAFAEHLTQLGAIDPRLRRAFERTRERYQDNEQMASAC